MRPISNDKEFFVPKKLLRARTPLSLLGMKLRTIALSQLEPANYLLGYSEPITITATDWQNIYIESENPYRDLKKALDNLLKCEVGFANGLKIKVLSCGKYLDTKGAATLEFNPDFLLECHET